jgi:iodotyrosine deiodinase
MTRNEAALLTYRARPCFLNLPPLRDRNAVNSPPNFIALEHQRYSPEDMQKRARSWFEEIRRRRSVRFFSTETVDLTVVETCIHSAAQAPSGANKQPWTFVMITNPELKRAIRLAAEEEEHAFYHGRAPQRWLDDLAAIGTDEHKEFLESAPVLIVIFAKRYGEDEQERNYYVNESVGIAAGFLIAALHHAGLATLTHTPSPMNFLSTLLERPKNERPYLLLPVGLPTRDCLVPNIHRRSLDEVLVRKL